METSPSPNRRTILFVDVVASVELYADLGDAEARARMAPCLQDLHDLVERHAGIVVKSLGDGVMAAFGGESAAVDSALTMPACAARYGLQVRVGVHTGDVLIEDDDVFGQAVNVASRLLNLARPSEILATREVIERVSSTLQHGARRLQDVAIKGLSEPLELFALGYYEPSGTISIGGHVERADASPSFGLEIRLGEQTWSVGPNSDLRLGRDQSNDLIIDDDHVSRRHALIGNRRGQYVLTDQSVNGTWLVSAGGNQVHLLREEATLQGAGEIHLGVPPGYPDAVPISYSSSA